MSGHALGPPPSPTGLPPPPSPPLSYSSDSSDDDPIDDVRLSPALTQATLPTTPQLNGSPPPPPGPPGAPPGYVATQPQILVLPLPDAPGFFWGRTLQGEVFVKGLGEARTRSVESLTVTARLTDRLPRRPDLDPVQVAPQVLYHTNVSEGSTAIATASAQRLSLDHPFPASHRFAIPLPAALSDGSVLPSSFDLGAAGSLRWTLRVRLALLSGEVHDELVNVEGAPPEIDVGEPVDDSLDSTEAVLERDGVRVRLLLACSRPRFGDPLRIGVEVRPQRPKRVTLAGLVAQADPDESLRPLRRVRVELVRLVDSAPEAGQSSSSTTHTHTSVVHASGKSLRYPGQNQPPLRVLFTLSTAPIHPGPMNTGGEISGRTPYHTVRFKVRATLGFGSIGDATGPGATDPGRDWCVEEEVTIRPPIWHEPRTAVIERGELPVPGHADPAAVETEESAREAYRRKGQDIVGASGTTRVTTELADLPPPFTDGPGPAGPAAPAGPSDTPGPSGTSSAPDATDNALPSFTESEAQMRSGQAPMLNHAVPSALLQPITFEDPFPVAPAPPRRGSLSGELATWVEYDGYERFSDPPPPAAASYGVASSMDPPREGDEDGDVVGSIVARLGLPSGSAPNPEELMEQLGLGQGTRVVDLEDDLPPGIDEPSLPALPGFGQPSHDHAHAHGRGQHGRVPQPPTFTQPFAQQSQAPQQHQHHSQQHHVRPPPHQLAQHHPRAPPFAPAPADHEHPPSFDASEAAEAAGGVARSRVGSITAHVQPLVAVDMGDAPPGYFGGGPPAYS